MMKKLLAIVGPTATGKTDLGIELAKKFKGETVACDSRQVYKGLDVATGKGTDWLYDVADPQEVYTVKDYIEQAREKIREIWDRENLAIVVGGSGLYLRGLLEGFPKTAIPQNFKLRQELEKLSVKDLQNKVSSLSPLLWGKLNQSERRNPRRLIRHLEILMSHNITDGSSTVDPFDAEVLKIGLTLPRSLLYSQIDQRIIFWLDHGLIYEVKKLLKEGVLLNRLYEIGLEYRLVTQFVQGEITKEKLIEKMKTTTRHYAKRQITWFQKDKDIHWFDVSQKNWQNKVVKLVDSWYYNRHETQD